VRWLLLAATPSLASCVAWPSHELRSHASAVSAACTSAAVRASACLVPRTHRFASSTPQFPLPLSQSRWRRRPVRPHVACARRQTASTHPSCIRTTAPRADPCCISSIPEPEPELSGFHFLKQFSGSKF